MERFLPLIYIIGWFSGVFVGSYLINWLLVRSIIRRYYRYFVAPGIIVHELSHALGCLITGSPIIEINFWKATGGHVKHLQPHDPFRRIVNDPIIALAPIWGTFLVLAALTWLMIPGFFTIIHSADLEITLRLFHFSSPISWLYLYLITSLLATVAPSKTDIMYALASLVVLTLILGLVLFFIPGAATSLLGLGQSIRPFALFTLGLMILGLIISFLLALPMRYRHFAVRPALD